ncbi:MAG: carbon-nitrogen hydrolase family protein, partial [Planctomycetota bacterium]|nr:carbon-nitrogen hydrolase family protein [Planctomycetota bacterium]
MKTLRIGLAQVNQTADFDANENTIFQFVEKASEAGVQALCFPETQTVGYRVDIATPDTPVPVEKLKNLHEKLARRCGELGMACILGTEIPNGEEKPFNSVVIISEEGEMIGTHHKTKLTPLDAIAYSPGEGFEVFEFFGIKTGVVICFEGFRFPETTRELVRQGAQLVFHP